MQERGRIWSEAKCDFAKIQNCCNVGARYGFGQKA